MISLGKEVIVMNISDRILRQRKIKGLSQEELADKIGVSRQAVSKWESEQTIPDIDKVILMSELFEVSTDFLLKGIEIDEPAKDRPLSAYVFVVVATFFDYVGVLTASSVWYEEQKAAALMVGFILMALSGLVFSIGYLNSDKDKEGALRLFWQLNIWGLIFIPLAVVYNTAICHSMAPYPLLGYPRIAYIIFWLVYFLIGTTVTLKQVKPKGK